MPYARDSKLRGGRLGIAVVAVSIVASVCIGGTLAAAEPPEVVDVRWGFDGSVRAGCFQPVSLLIRNPHSAPIRGPLMLEERGAFGKLLAPPHARELYLSPGASRWIQFYVQRTDSVPASDWFVRLASDEPWEEKLPEPPEGPAARVLLAPADGYPGSLNGLPTFPEELFPTVNGALDHLALVALDHDPSWTSFQRQAFLDWLAAGGELHLFLSPDGTVPRLTGVLETLNRPDGAPGIEDRSLARPLLGSRIFRHSRALREGRPPRLEVVSDLARASDRPFSDHAGVLGALYEWSRPAHPWVWIHLAGLLFVLCVGPLHWWYSSRQSGFLRSKLALVGILVVFSVALFFLGSVGFEGSERIYAVSEATVIGPGRYDVQQQAVLRVRAGGERVIRGEGKGSLYATPTSLAATTAPGRVHNGPEGFLEVSLPLYSSWAFRHRANYEAEALLEEVSSCTVRRGRLESLVVQVSPEYTPLIGAWVRYQEKMYEMTVIPGGRLVLSDLTYQKGWRAGYGQRWGNSGEEWIERYAPDEILEAHMLRLKKSLSPLLDREDQVELFVYTEARVFSPTPEVEWGGGYVMFRMLLPAGKGSW